MTAVPYVALGDSLTCGVGDGCWPDLVAEALGVEHANLAAVGATSRDVAQAQLPRALELRPQLITLVCGANDVLESVRPDAELYSAWLSGMFEHIEHELPGAVLLTATYPDLSHLLDLRERTRARVRRGVREYNAVCREVAREHGVLCVDWSEHRGSAESTKVGADGFHPSAEGHRHAAGDVLRALGGALPGGIPSKEFA